VDEEAVDEDEEDKDGKGTTNLRKLESVESKYRGPGGFQTLPMIGNS
jgi:hypothetical protein